MKARRFSAHSVLGITILLSCAGGSRGDGNGSGGSEVFPPYDPNGGGDRPPPGFDMPPSDYDGPGGGDVPPPGYDNPSGPAGEIPDGTCPRLCQAIRDHACEGAEEDAETCEADCMETLSELGPCTGSAVALLECIFHSRSFTCEGLEGEISQGDYNECTRQAYDYINCSELNDGTGGTGGTSGEGGAPPDPTGGTGPGPMGGMAGGGMPGAGTAGGGTGGT